MRGDELRQWQMQKRVECLKARNEILSEMIGRLLIVHFDWDIEEQMHRRTNASKNKCIEEQMHLDHISLKARVQPEAEVFVVDSRLKKSIGLKQWEGQPDV